MGRKDTCDIYCYNESIVNEVREKLKKDDIARITSLFKLLADENRAKISYALTLEKELCVCDIANIIGSSVATASHHLRTLHRQGVVSYRKEGKLAFYSLVDEHVRVLLQTALEHRKDVRSNV
ncbi:cadmium-sensing regulator CadC [Melghiribacillus thermohalophilus]|uniref:Cadmium-sensing regulator CadC n=1 Tax=Melghiribacillus thermohalophilus TaxID=1324956 RepID=A0A4R3NBU8_9BACI|nr:metalloregulator ArsR/SmtB family transcription factor [Melghiribacillus thermohalophilus]TCT27149.1 cadmium-sensing regulator CadC [Melghiribacillus thermohalophilus]